MRHRSARWALLLGAVLGTVTADGSAADELEIAVAANFATTLRDLAERFEQQTGHVVKLASGSTGKHVAQIVNGAPFDAFFAADRDSPERLETDGLAISGTRFTYAIGRLVLYSRWEDLVDADGAVLTTGGFRHLAIANPKLAPYGRAARQVLDSEGLWDKLQGRIVRGENIGQAFQFIVSGNAELGFIAWSQLMSAGEPISGSYWLVPSDLYSPIEQQAVMLVDSGSARAFWAWIQSDEARSLIRERGYGDPP